MLRHEEAVAAGLADTVFELLPPGRDAPRQMVEHGRLLQPVDGGFDLCPAAERIEIGFVARVAEERASGLDRAVRGVFRAEFGAELMPAMKRRAGSGLCSAFELLLRLHLDRVH